MHPNPPAFRFPDPYPDYFEGGILKSEYLTNVPEDLARFLGNEGQLTMHQLRAFYGHAKRAEDASRRGLPLAGAVKEIRKLVPIAADRLGKKKITPTFHRFLRDNALYVRTDDSAATLKAFLEHFEALVGFCQGKLKEKERT